MHFENFHKVVKNLFFSFFTKDTHLKKTGHSPVFLSYFVIEIFLMVMVSLGETSRTA